MRNRANLAPAADVFIRINTQGNRGDSIADFTHRPWCRYGARFRSIFQQVIRVIFHGAGFLFNGVWWIISCDGRIVNGFNDELVNDEL